MKTRRIVLSGFTRMSDDELLVRATTIHQAMSSSPFFAGNGPILSDLETCYLDFQNFLAICKRKGSPLDTANKNVAREALMSTLQQVAAVVMRLAKGDLQKLLSSGFELSTPPKSRDFPDMVTNVYLSEGKQSGQMRLDFEKAKHALMYEYRYAVLDGEVPGEWSEPLMTTSTRANILAPLTPYIRHFVQVRSVNAFGKSDWSDTVSYIIR
ncbi:MAG: fibronectin type III domain-containing protein [Chitinophagaceae bacterium]|nr:MAG: fibronectin type III domain-containing protein [Chitinophagaceae bacterium]